MRKYNRRCIAVISVWIAFLALSLISYGKNMVPTLSFYNVNNPYTADSVWEGTETNWHNDTLLYTLFSQKTVYINPKSWYIAYVDAIAEHVVRDESIAAMVDGQEKDNEGYRYLNHMIATQNSTLFSRDVVDAISSQPEGAASLYVDEAGIASAEGIAFYHDQYGNVYLKGYAGEEYK